MTVAERNNINIGGHGDETMVFLHGFGCDQNMWRFVEPEFSRDFRTLRYDLTGLGKADRSFYSLDRHATLHGHAYDLLEILDAYNLSDVTFVGHSVSCMIGLLAAVQQPSRFARLIMAGPSPCYLNDGDYHGGFTSEEIESLIETLELNYLGWAHSMAPVIMGNPDRPELGEELAESFCRNDPKIAGHFARVTFHSDQRADLPRCTTPTLILQCSRDVIAPPSVGDYLHRNLTNSQLVQLKATGHCPNLSAPAEMIAHMHAFLAAQCASSSPRH